MLCIKFQKQAYTNACPSSKNGLKNNSYSLQAYEPITYRVWLNWPAPQNIPPTKWIKNQLRFHQFEELLTKMSKTTLNHLLFFPHIGIFEESFGRIFPRWSPNTSRPSDHRVILGNLMHQILWTFLQFWAINIQQKRKESHKSRGKWWYKVKS